MWLQQQDMSPVYKSSKVCVTEILVILNATCDGLCVSYAHITPLPNTNGVLFRIKTLISCCKIAIHYSACILTLSFHVRIRSLHAKYLADVKSFADSVVISPHTQDHIVVVLLKEEVEKLGSAYIYLS